MTGKRWSNRWSGLAVGLIGAVLFSACSPATPSSTSSSAPVTRPAVETANDSRAGGGFVAPAPTSAPASRPAQGGAAAPPAPGATGAQPGGGGGPELPTNRAVLGDRKIIYTGDATIEVQNPLDVAARIAQIAEDLGGYVANSSTSLQGERQIANMSLRVPAESYQTALTRIRALAEKVPSEKTSSQDVSEEFADLQAQQRNLEETEARYLEFLKRANTIEEVLRVQAQISSVRGQIERIKGRLNFLDRRSELATINLTIVPPAVVAKPKSTTPNPLESAQEAFEASLRFLTVIATAFITFIAFFWWAIIPAGIFVWWLRSRLVRRRPTPPAPPAAPAAAAA